MKQASTERTSAASSANDMPGLMATIKDLQAELQRQRQQTEALATLHWEFLRHIGHEIRNPMTAIIGMTDLAMLTDPSEEQRECLATVQNAARTLMRVLNNMQDYARLQAGTLELEWSGFRLRGCLRESITKLAPQAQAKGLELLCRVATNVPDAIVADLRRLVQVLEHLLSNAILYTHRGEVSLEVTTVKETVKEVTLRFRVRDTGVGMSLEDAARVTSSWTRPRSNDSRTRSGAGLGLPMTVGLVQLFGGEFKIQSQVGQGTECEFTGTFLKQQSPKEHAADEQARQKLASRRVMIAVANDTSRRWLTEACQQMGMEVIVSEPGLAAARACAAEAAPPVEMALVDESLFDLAASPQDRLRAMSDLAVAKVILSTPGNAPTSAAPEAANIVATVAKPWFAEDLQRALLAAVDNLDAQTPRRPYDNVSPEKANQDIHGKESNKERSMLQCEPKEAIARLGGDDELYGEVVRRFRDEGPKVLQTLRRHLESGNADVLHRAAHSFKGLAAMSGAAAVALQAAEIERLGRQGDLQQVEPLLNTLAAAIQQANVELATYM